MSMYFTCYVMLCYVMLCYVSLLLFLLLPLYLHMDNKSWIFGPFFLVKVDRTD